MGEIKSTLDLVMERTRKMPISEKEKEKIKEKEVLQRTQGLSHRYLEGSLSFNDVLRELEKNDEKMRSSMKRVLIEGWINALSFKGEEEKLLKGIESLTNHPLGEIRHRVDRLHSEYEHERAAVEQDLEDQLREALKKVGISGSAVTPNVEASPQWKERLVGLEQRFQTQIEEIKALLKQS